MDHITSELKRLSRGALLYKIDVSRAFRHMRIDPGDYDLLGLQCCDAYVNTCIPFGTRHRSQIFQHLSNAVLYVMRQGDFASLIILMITSVSASLALRMHHMTVSSTL